MENARHFDRALVTPAIDKKMTRRLHVWAAHPAAAEFQVMGPRAFDHNVRSLLGAWALGIDSDIADGLLNQRLIARYGVLSKFLAGPIQDRFDVTLGRAGKSNFEPSRSALRHASVRWRIRPQLLVQVDR